MRTNIVYYCGYYSSIRETFIEIKVNWLAKHITSQTYVYLWVLFLQYVHFYYTRKAPRMFLSLLTFLWQVIISQNVFFFIDDDKGLTSYLK